MNNMTTCKICNSGTELYGVCDFNKNCEERFGLFLPLSGIPVYYHRCTNCGCIFTTHFDSWSKEDFATKIYNADYATVDPHWETIRPTENANMIASIFSPCTVIDYGGGAGTFAALLNARGFNATTYDPFYCTNSKPTHTAGLVTCYEVFEHTTTPHETLDDCINCLDDVGVLHFSTLAVDFLKPRAMDAASDASYISPRNGHVTIHTRKSIQTLCSMHNLRFRTTDDRFFTAVKI